MIQHLCIEHKILGQWLKAGFMEKGKLFPTNAGTPQGGVISPCLANGALDGIEAMLKTITKPTDKVHMVRYADDFVITGRSKELLENTIKPAITVFLQGKGLMLSAEKTLITTINQGFDFLGFNVRKYGDKLLIKPSKSSIKSFLSSIRMEIKKGISTSLIQLIRSLNRKIIGWVNYYRHVVAKNIFSDIDSAIFWALYQMIRRKHPRKSAKWLYRKYYTNRGLRRWIFHSTYRISNGEGRLIRLKFASDTPIRRHRQIISVATPYDANYLSYFENRVRKYSHLEHATGSNSFDFMRA
jgi:RNA-directed DNA polymerase